MISGTGKRESSGGNWYAHDDTESSASGTAEKDFPLMNVTEIPIDGLAYAIEMGKEESFIYGMINEAVQKAGAESVDAAVLACTHYPLVAGVFRDILPNTLLIDPAERTVKKRCPSWLIKMGSLRKRDHACFSLRKVPSGRKFL